MLELATRFMHGSKSVNSRVGLRPVNRQPVTVESAAPSRVPIQLPEGIEDFEPRARSERICRVFNVTVALCILVVAAPVMALAALLVRLTSKGPIFYMQVRVGIDRRYNKTRALRERRREDLGGVPFTIYKFRSMRVDAEVNGQAVWAKQEDDRVTAVGKIMRKSRIDELPQLLNVIRGDMNIVGPRPERPSIFVRLREQISEYPVRQRVKPGITGLAQISNPYDRDIEDVRRKVAFDIAYMRQQSITEDVRIMLRTIPVMIFRIGGW